MMRRVVAAVFVLSTVACVADRAARLPAPPSVYEKVGSVDGFSTGPSHLRADVWIVKSSEFIDAIQSDPSCPLRMEGDRLVDCRNQVYSVKGDPKNYLEGPDTPNRLRKLCTWVYPLEGDLYVYFGGTENGCPR